MTQGQATTIAQIANKHMARNWAVPAPMRKPVLIWFPDRSECSTPGSQLGGGWRWTDTGICSRTIWTPWRTLST